MFGIARPKPARARRQKARALMLISMSLNIIQAQCGWQVASIGLCRRPLSCSFEIPMSVGPGFRRMGYLAIRELAGWLDGFFDWLVGRVCRVKIDKR